MTRSGFVALCLAVFISLPYVRMDAHEARYAGAAAETAKEDFRHAVMLFDRGMYDRAMVIFDALAEKNDDYQAEGYSVLCQILLQTGDCGHRVREYAGRYPYSWLLPQIRYRYALDLFDKDDYEGAAAEFAMISRARLHRDQADEFLFKASGTMTAHICVSRISTAGRCRTILPRRGMLRDIYAIAGRISEKPWSGFQSR